MAEVKAGLEDIVVGKQDICFIDGDKGELIYRGYHIELSLEPDMFTVMFAISRIAGWAAHIMHQYEDNRLIRPRAEYVGPKGLKWTPLGER